MKTVSDLTDLKDKNVLLRVDFDVPVSPDRQIQESFRIKKQKAMLDYLVSRGARVVMVAHISAVPSFAELVPQFHLLLGYEINFIKSVPEIGAYLDRYAGPALLDNVRQNPGEEKNDPEFAKQLAAGFDIYINNAFAVSHRAHASVSAIAGLLPSYAGLQFQEEVAQLGGVLTAPAAGKIIIIGGAKASTKVPVVKNLIGNAERVLVGGVVANDILKEKGHAMGASIVDEDSHALLAGLDLSDPKLMIPTDFVISEDKILDIGEGTTKQYADATASGKLIIWNGPMGMFENPEFAKGTVAVAQAVIASSAFKVMGGGDTISAVDKLGLLEKFDFVSTGGGAMLDFLAGNKLPGLEALN